MDNSQNYKNKRVTVMGIGLHGGAVEMIKWLLFQGARVVATDLRSAKELVPSLEKLKGLKNLEIVTGIHRGEDFTGTDLVIKNPAVRWDNEYIQLALRKKIPVEMDSSLFFQHCKSKQIIGITGTKGKTTTSFLIAEILKKAGEKVTLVGVGQENVMGKLKEIDEKTWVVFELSSWRLSALKRKKISPPGAVVINFLQDHLNYYSDMQEYGNDKKAIFEFQKNNDWLVIEKETLTKLDPQFKDELKQRAAYFSEKLEPEKRNVFIEDGKVCFQWDGKVGILGGLDELKLKGKHNWNNILAAVSVGLFLEIESKIIWQVTSEFSGVEHRLELVRELKGIKFYNDTTATTPESGVLGIQAFENTIHLIAGGSNKNLNLEIFAQEIATNKNVKKVYLLEGVASGELKDLIEKFGGASKIVGVFPVFEEAIKISFEKALHGEIVLLSPGCASFGMFQNEFDRGEKFKKAVRELK